MSAAPRGECYPFELQPREPNRMPRVRRVSGRGVRAAAAITTDSPPKGARFDTAQGNVFESS